MEIKLKSYINACHEASDYVLEQFHSCYELVFYAKGSGNSTINGETCYFKDKSIALITPGSLHDEYSTTETQVYCCLFTYEGEFELKNGIYQPPGEEESARLELLFLQIDEEMRAKKTGYASLLDYLLGQIVTYFVRMTVTDRANPYDCIAYTKQYLKENSGSNLSFQLLADQIGYSYDRFRHIFRETVGISPAKYLYNVRIDKAKKLLLNSGYSVSQIAKMTNLGSVAHFVDIFKKETGLTPLKFRKTLEHSSEEVLNLTSGAGRHFSSNSL